MYLKNIRDIGRRAQDTKDEVCIFLLDIFSFSLLACMLMTSDLGTSLFFMLCVLHKIALSVFLKSLPGQSYRQNWIKNAQVHRNKVWTDLFDKWFKLTEQIKILLPIDGQIQAENVDFGPLYFIFSRGNSGSNGSHT